MRVAAPTVRVKAPSLRVQRVFAQPIPGIPKPMDQLNRLLHAQQRVATVQRRVWLAQMLLWPAVIGAGALSVVGLSWIRQRRYGGDRHEMPDTPGAHETGTLQVQPDGRLAEVPE